MNDLAGVVGRLNGIHAEPGTLLGPDPDDPSGRYFAVAQDDAEGVSVRYALPNDIRAADNVDEPRSVAEMTRRLTIQRAHAQVAQAEDRQSR